MSKEYRFKADVRSVSTLPSQKRNWEMEQEVHSLLNKIEQKRPRYFQELKARALAEGRATEKNWSEVIAKGMAVAIRQMTGCGTKHELGEFEVIVESWLRGNDEQFPFTSEQYFVVGGRP
jgi:hypothetical protein